MQIVLELLQLFCSLFLNIDSMVIFPIVSLFFLISKLHCVYIQSIVSLNHSGSISSNSCAFLVFITVKTSSSSSIVNSSKLILHLHIPYHVSLLFPPTYFSWFCSGLAFYSHDFCICLVVLLYTPLFFRSRIILLYIFLYFLICFSVFL